MKLMYAVNLSQLFKSIYFCVQATHVAAQYGQTAFIYHIVAKWNADPDVPDNDGRSPLHWFVLVLYASQWPTCSFFMCTL